MKLAWVTDILEEMAQHIAKPIYFVLGNHDYYHSSVENVIQKVTQLSQDNPDIDFLFLFGHNHSSSYYKPFDNLKVKAGSV